MDDWLRYTLALCIYGFFREFRPSEPFIIPFLDGPWREVTMEQVTQLVYPIATYCNLALLVVVFLVTDMLKCVKALGEVIVQFLTAILELDTNH